jgi:hypothetical protein
MRILLLGLLLIASHSLVAGPSSYICQITDFKVPGTNTEDREWVGETAMNPDHPSDLNPDR